MGKSKNVIETKMYVVLGLLLRFFMKETIKVAGVKDYVLFVATSAV